MKPDGLLPLPQFPQYHDRSNYRSSNRRPWIRHPETTQQPAALSDSAAAAVMEVDTARLSCRCWLRISALLGVTVATAAYTLAEAATNAV